MAKVNFVTEWNLFMRFARDNALTAAERMLWQGLFYVMNERARYDAQTREYDWPDGVVVVSNDEIALYSGLSKKAIERARETLCGLGLIEYVPGNRNSRNPGYKMRWLSIGAELRQTPVTPDWRRTGDDSETVHGQAGAGLATNCSRLDDKLTTEKSENVANMSPICPQGVPNDKTIDIIYNTQEINKNLKAAAEAEETEDGGCGGGAEEIAQEAEDYGLPLAKGNLRDAEKLKSEYGVAWVKEAIRRAGQKAETRSWRYVAGVLRSFRAQGGMDAPRTCGSGGKTVTAQGYGQRSYRGDSETEMLLEQLQEAGYAAG